jgi:hypothetical protein
MANILNFSPTFYFFQFFLQKSFYRMEKSLFVDFCQIFENKKSKIHHLGFSRHFERFPKALFYKMLILLSTKNREKHVFRAQFKKIGSTEIVVSVRLSPSQRPLLEHSRSDIISYWEW